MQIESACIDMSDSHAELQRRLETWLRAEDIRFENKPNPQAYFHLLVQFNGVPLQVAEIMSKSGMIVITGVLRLSPNQITIFQEMQEEAQNKFFWDLRFTLNDRENHFQIKDDVSDPNWLTVQRILYVDDLKRSSFLNALKEIDSTFRRTLWLLDKHSGSPKPRSPPPSMYR